MERCDTDLVDLIAQEVSMICLLIDTDRINVSRQFLSRTRMNECRFVLMFMYPRGDNNDIYFEVFILQQITIKWRDKK